LRNDWRALAACAAAIERGGADPSWWFPTRHDAASPATGCVYARARAICAVCPVRRECLEECLTVEAAMGRNEITGMFGGKTPKERVALRRRRRRVVAVA
jgi:Transcription factor WhiB